MNAIGHPAAPTPDTAIIIPDDPAPEPVFFAAEKLRNLSIPPGALFASEDLVHRLKGIVKSSANGQEALEPSADGQKEDIDPSAIGQKETLEPSANGQKEVLNPSMNGQDEVISLSATSGRKSWTRPRSTRKKVMTHLLMDR